MADKKGFGLSQGDILGLSFSAVGLILAAIPLFLRQATVAPASTLQLPPPETAPPSTPLLLPGDAWVLYGDSLVGGMPGSDNPGGLTPPLAALSNAYQAPFHALGKKGSTIMEWAYDVDKTLSAVDADYKVVAICLGSNDVWFPTHPDESTAIHDLVTFMQQKGAQVVWIIPPGMNGSSSVDPPRKTELLNQLTAQAEKDGFLLWNPGHVPLVPEAHPVHPTGPGYTQMANDFFAFLTKTHVPLAA